MTRILLVEDELKIANFMILGLQGEGYEVHHEIEGLSALQSLFKPRFSIRPDAVDKTTQPVRLR